MRLWSLHPCYLDWKGLGADWREGLLGQAIILGRTKGWRNHPQMDRFKGLLGDTLTNCPLDDRG